MKTFIQTFHRPEQNSECSNTTPEDCKFWETFSFEKLEENIEIPSEIHVFRYYQSEENLDDPENFKVLKTKIRENMKTLINEPLKVIDEHKETFLVLLNTSFD